MLKSFREHAVDVVPRLPDPAAVRAALSALLQFLVLAALAFALSRATVANLDPMAALAPFALALFAAGVVAGGNAAALLTGCVLGSIREALYTFNLSIPIGCAVILGGSLSWSLIEPRLGRLRAALRRAPEIQARSPNRARADAVTCATLAGLGVLAPGLCYSGGMPWPSAQAVAAALCAMGSAPFLKSALALRPDRRYLLPEERTGLFLMLCALSAGIFAVFPPAALCLSGVAAALAWPQAGVIGMGAGGAMLLCSGDPRYAAALGLCGAATQLCGHSPRLLRTICASLTALAASACAGLNPLEMAGLCAAPPLAMLMPKALRACALRWSKGASDTCDADRLALMLRGQTSRRLRAMSAAFGDLAEGYLKPVTLPDEQALIGNLREKLCADCPGYAACWTGDSNRGARLLCDLIAQAVRWSESGTDAPLYEEGVSTDVVRRCRRGRSIPDRAGEALEDFARARRGELKRGGENRLISAQFLQAQRLIDALAAEQARPIRLRDRQAARAAGVLERAGIRVSDALLISGPRTELVLTLGEGRWSAALARAASARMHAAFGRVYAPEESWGSTMRFIRKPKMMADVGVVSMPREAGAPSGDSHVTAMLDDDRMMVLICDGMGSGEAAARESAQAARLLGRFLAAGSGWSLAIETVNALMLNTAAEDMFSTVDLLLLDLSTGMAEFMKLAACPALIARGGEVQRIEGGRLPLGILDRVTPAASRVRLMPGDTVLMASDGVMDAVDPQALDMLLTAPGDDMNALAEKILDLARLTEGCRDDMTAVCLRVRENEG